MLKKITEYGIGSILTLLIGFISSPIITRLVTPEQNGKFSMFNTITNLLLLIVMMGLDQSYIRYYYDEDDNNRGLLLYRCIKIPLFLNAIVAILMIVFYKALSVYMVEETSFLIIILLIINLFFSTISRFVLLEIRMRQRAKIYSLLNIIQKLANLIFIVLTFLMYQNHYLTLVIAMVLSNLTVILFAISFERNILKSLEQIKPLKTSTKELILYGFPLVFTMAITWIFQSIDRLVLREIHGFAEVGIYNGAMTIISLLNAVQSTFTTFWVPIAYERFSENPNDKNFFVNAHKIITVTMLIIAVGLIAGKDIIILLVGEQYRNAVFIFPFLVFMPIMYTISETTVLGINFMKKTKLHIYISSITAIFNLIGNLILVPKLGALGASISTGIAYIILFCLRTGIARSLYSINFDLWKFFVCTLLVYILAIYSSFNTLNVTIIMASLLIVLIICILYNEIFFKVGIFVKSKKIYR